MPELFWGGAWRLLDASLITYVPKSGGGLADLQAAGVEVEIAEGELGVRARRQNEAWRTWIALGRPFVTYKTAITVDGREHGFWRVEEDRFRAALT